MSHLYHEGLKGFDARQILHDHCPECEARGKDLPNALAHLDNDRFRKAWRRAYDWEASSGDYDAVGPVSFAEVELLKVLWGVQVLLERLGTPLDGEVPAVANDERQQREESLRQAAASVEQEHWRKHDEGRGT